MNCAIMQPSYFPWAGYFNLINKADTFVFLDDVQFSKNSWHNRNSILVKQRKIWITVPLKKSKLNTKLNEKIIDNFNDWKSKHIKTIKQSYASHQFVADLNELTDFLQGLDCKIISELNISLIKFIASKLKIGGNFINSSQINVDKKRTDKIIEILTNLKATNYFSPLGAKEYLTKDNFKKNTNINLTINNFVPKQYSQPEVKKFVTHLSVIDVIANLGWTGTRNYVI